MTLAVFSRFGTIPDEKERLNRYNRGSEISSLMALSNFGVILSGPGDYKTAGRFEVVLGLPTLHQLIMRHVHASCMLVSVSAWLTVQSHYHTDYTGESTRPM